VNTTCCIITFGRIYFHGLFFAVRTVYMLFSCVILLNIVVPIQFIELNFNLKKLTTPG
jgi:hypothetical protein